MKIFAVFLFLSAATFSGNARAAGAAGADDVGPDRLAQDVQPDSGAAPSPQRESLIPKEALPDLTMGPKLNIDNGTLKPPPIQRDLSTLPAPVRATHKALLEAAKSGRLEALRRLIDQGADGTLLSLSGLDGDPIDYLRQSSGDEEGFEILAILVDVLEAGFVHLASETDEEVYVWPYFVAWPLDTLTPQNRVELFRILTAGDVQDSEEFGGYIFYRVGIRPDGAWRFFVAGD